MLYWSFKSWLLSWPSSVEKWDHWHQGCLLLDIPGCWTCSAAACSCRPWSRRSASEAWRSGSPAPRTEDTTLSDCSQRRSWISVQDEWPADHKNCTKNIFGRKQKSFTCWTYFESLGTAGDCSEDVVAVHGAEDELGTIPDLAAVVVPALQSRGPALQTPHADCRQVWQSSLRLHLLCISSVF